MKFNKILIAAGLLTLSSATLATPTLINFQSMADGSWGESAWDPLSLTSLGFDLDITASWGNNSAYAYLDRGTAGLGVCRNLTSTGLSKLNSKTASGTNLCNPSSDDNVNVYNNIGETLNFNFNEDIVISKIWFNNNHDPDYGMDGDSVSLASNTFSAFNHTFAGPANNANLGWLFEFSGSDGYFSANDILNISYFDEEFYISAIELDTYEVPEPGTLALFGLGLLGLGFRRRRTTSR